jgi:hypothetical protein
MNLNQLKTPALFFFAGYGFFMIDHWHKSIMNHTYHIALIAFGMFVVHQLLSRKQSNNTPAQTGASSLKDVDLPPMITQQNTQGKTIRLKEKQEIKV